MKKIKIWEQFNKLENRFNKVRLLVDEFCPKAGWNYRKNENIRFQSIFLFSLWVLINRHTERAICENKIIFEDSGVNLVLRILMKSLYFSLITVL